MSRDFLALVLAAGKGTRFKSNKIKVLHKLINKPMVQWTVDTIRKLKPDKIYIIVGFQKEDVQHAIGGDNVEYVIQKEQLGTGHAVMAAYDELKADEEKDLLVINGDLPLIQPDTLRLFYHYHRKQGNSLTFMTADLEDPTGFGRLIQGPEGYLSIIEEKDATPEQRKIKEANVGIYLFRIKDLLETIRRLDNKNVKAEYYLTDMIEIMGRSQKKVGPFKTKNVGEIIGVNDRMELAKAIDVLRLRKIQELTDQGVTILDPSSVWIDHDVHIGSDTTIYPFVTIECGSKIGKNCVIYSSSHIFQSKIGDDVRILPSTVIEESTVEKGVQVGPFSHLRPKTTIRSGARVGNFVEMKNTIFGRGSKAGHLTYLGDAQIGEKVNIGAGTITCNYDGIRKNKTIIDSEAFIGSGTELVAPVTVGKKAYIGAGSTITKNVSPESLAVARSRQVEKSGWMRRKKRILSGDKRD
ncbi:MAG: bifunctional UDP-N-acetylglucosamine diphosphorylase/glucosamine-1-phosphate N-acetyltransferase GlmU [Candidatus Aminicenantes bacterium]|nr:bifunctional UDP-N-acetylglucosamine diphosphorylase/glucosamine-1-phosphate N-acetyltransferase GlmU [Candidatus Aminicenantes bacterium]